MGEVPEILHGIFQHKVEEHGEPNENNGELNHKSGQPLEAEPDCISNLESSRTLN